MIDNVKIGAMTYTVEMVEGLHITGDDGERKDLHGQIWPDKLKIEVELNQDTQMQIATVLHESMHGILNHAGQDHEERLIIALGYGLVQFIRDNPELIDLIQHGERRTMVLSEATLRLFYGEQNLCHPVPHMTNGGKE